MAPSLPRLLPKTMIFPLILCTSFWHFGLLAVILQGAAKSQQKLDAVHSGPT